MSNIDPVKYIDFVDQTTSQPSKNVEALQERISGLMGDGADVSHLVTAAFGLTAEAGEFTEIVKKILHKVNLTMKRTSST